MRFICLFVVLIVAETRILAENPPEAESSGARSVVTTYTKQGWLVQESKSFRIFCSSQLNEAKRLPETCEALRRQLQDTWSGNDAPNWSPRCDIVVHSTVAGYVRELGPESRQSSGCATINIAEGKVNKRRIDLRADAADWLTTALPHELTHVILAEHFTDRQIPRWVDEGIAILAEPEGRQETRQKAMTKALARNSRFSAAELLALQTYPSAERRDIFYGQSASLVTYLIERDSPARFLEFVRKGQKTGFDQALADVYQIQSVAELDRHWRPRMLNRGPAAELFASRISRITSGVRID
jgi:hypothetical protein